MARPLKIIDPKLVRNLASIFCSMEQIAIACDCSVDTLERRFADIIKAGRETGKTSLLKKQFEVAMSGNVGLLIWLGKQYLGQSDVEKTELKRLDDKILEMKQEINILKIVKNESA
jgi:hypothetical protein